MCSFQNTTYKDFMIRKLRNCVCGEAPIGLYLLNSYYLPLFFCPSFHVFVFCDCFAIDLRSPKIPPPSGFSLSRFSFSSSYSFAVLNFQISNYGRANRFSLPSYTPKISPQFSIPHKFLPPHYFMPHHGSHPAYPTLSTEHCSNVQRECFHSICITVQE